mgnify:CR=1 FL=1
MKTVVITGCCGFIGSAVTRICLEKGWKVLGIDKMTYVANKDLNFESYDNFTFLEKDICEVERIPDCDYVINLAAESHVGNSITDSAAFTRTNVEGVRHLLDLIRQKPENVVSKPILFHFSTDEVYGDGLEYATEDSPLNPSNPYSASKAAADMLIRASHRTYGIDYLILRPSNNYGKNQYPEKLIPLSVKLLQRGKKVRLHNQGTPVRTWLHAEDTAAAVITIIESGEKNETYNVGGENEQTNLTTVSKILSCFFEEDTDCSDWVDLEYSRPGQDVRYRIDDTKLRALGWSPKKKFDEEISSLVKHYGERFIW